MIVRAAPLLLTFYVLAGPAAAAEIHVTTFGDVRLVAPPVTGSYLDGGLGKLRYGADDPDPGIKFGEVIGEASATSLAVGEKRTFDIAVTPPADQAEGIYSYKLRVAAGNAQGGDVPIYVSITQSGIGNALFKASDIFTGTLDTAGKRIAGVSGARIELQNELVISDTRVLNTDNLGEAFFTDVPAGRYKFRATASNHQEVIGRVSIKPGITATEDVFLDFNLVTVEWSVREITLQDKYEIILKATFQTDVPAAVVVMEPASVTIPTMKPGDVFYGEINITNYGLIRADHVAFTPPKSDAFFRFEFLKEVPTSLEAKQRVTIPYRIVSLVSLDQPSSTGGGCFLYQAIVTIVGDYVCVNGVLTRTGSSTIFTVNYGVCSGTPPPTNPITSGNGGPDAGGFNGPGGPDFISLPSAACVPPGPCNSACCNGNGTGGK